MISPSGTRFKNENTPSYPSHLCDEYLNFPYHFLGALLPAPVLYPHLVTVMTKGLKLNSYYQRKRFFHRFLACRVSFFDLRNKTAHEKKKPHMQENYEKNACIVSINSALLVL